MKAKMKVMVVGYGSIGRRHVRNLSKLNCIDEIIVYTKIKDRSLDSVDKKVRFIDGASLSLAQACKNLDIKFAIIANQTYKHIDTAILLAEKGINLLIEKPISHNFQKIDVLKKIVKKNKLNILVAYNLRFLPAIRYIKDRLLKNKLGDVYFARIEAGRYLPKWRQKTNYSDSYSVSKKFGGGVALDLSHEIDYMRYFFGDPLQWKALRSKVSDITIDSEDVFEGIYRYSKGLICNIHLDYLQKIPVRQIKIIGSKGYIICDLVGGWLEISEGKKIKRITDGKIFKIEDTYVNMLSFFIDGIGSKKGSVASIDEGIKALKLLEDSNV